MFQLSDEMSLSGISCAALRLPLPERGFPSGSSSINSNMCQRRSKMNNLKKAGRVNANSDG